MISISAIRVAAAVVEAAVAVAMVAAEAAVAAQAAAGVMASKPVAMARFAGVAGKTTKHHHKEKRPAIKPAFSFILPHRGSVLAATISKRACAPLVFHQGAAAVRSVALG